MTIKSHMLHSRSKLALREGGQSYTNHDANEIHDDRDVAQVIDTCVRKDGNRYYKIRWKDTWEPEEYLQGCNHLIRKFWERLEDERNKLQMEREGLSNGLKDSIISPQEHEYKSPSPSQLNTTGRRKGRPKKLLSHSEPNEDEELDVVSNTSNESLRVMIPPVTSQVPSQTASPERVEQYPVMILQENNEEGPAVLNVKDKLRRSHEKQMEPRINTVINTSSMDNSNDLIKVSEKRRYVELELNNEISKFQRVDSCIRSPIFLNTSESLHQRSNRRLSITKPPETVLSSSNFSFIKENKKIGLSNEKLCSSKQSVIVSSTKTIQPPIEKSQLLLKVTSPVYDTTSYKANDNINDLNKEVKLETKSKIILPKQQKRIMKGETLYHITADGEQRPQCGECFQTFKKRAALDRHMMIHRGIKPFQCHFCNQRFRQKHHLQGHIMLHTGERPHSCTLCQKRFRMRHHLLEHERISHKLFRDTHWKEFANALYKMLNGTLSCLRQFLTTESPDEK